MSDKSFFKSLVIAFIIFMFSLLFWSSCQASDKIGDFGVFGKEGSRWGVGAQIPKNGLLSRCGMWYNLENLQFTFFLDVEGRTYFMLATNTTEFDELQSKGKAKFVFTEGKFNDDVVTANYSIQKEGDVVFIKIPVSSQFLDLLAYNDVLRLYVDTRWFVVDLEGSLPAMKALTGKCFDYIVNE